MKKLFAIAAVAALFVACNGKPAAESACCAQDSAKCCADSAKCCAADSAVVDSAAVDSVAADSTVVAE